MMTHESITSKLLTLSATRFRRDPKNLRADQDFFDALGIDSYQAMDLLTELENEFDIEVPDYELQGVHTFAELAEVIKRRL